MAAIINKPPIKEFNKNKPVNPGGSCNDDSQKGKASKGVIS